MSNLLWVPPPIYNNMLHVDDRIPFFLRCKIGWRSICKPHERRPWGKRYPTTLIQEGVQLWVCTTYGLGTIFCELHSTQGSQRYHAWRCSLYEQPGSNLPIRIPVQLCLRTTHRHGTNFPSVHYIQSREIKDTMLGGLHRTNSRAAAPSQIFYCSCHNTGILERQEGVQLWAYDVQTWNKVLWSTFYPEKSNIPCLEAFIVRTAGQPLPCLHSSASA